MRLVTIDDFKSLNSRDQIEIWFATKITQALVAETYENHTIIVDVMGDNNGVNIDITNFFAGKTRILEIYKLY